MRRLIMSRLLWIYAVCKSLLLSSMAVKELNAQDETGFAVYGLALLPSIICLGRLRIASKYIFNLWQLRQGVDSLAQWLEHWIFNQEDLVRIPW